jgi:hypothetical protein
MNLGMILLAIGIVAFSVVVTLGVYYAATGEWLWGRDKVNRSNSRNWTPR